MTSENARLREELAAEREDHRDKREQLTTAFIVEQTALKEELAEAKRELFIQTQAAAHLGRLVAEKDADRTFFRDKAEQAEARALANEKDALIHRKLREIALPRYAVRIESGDTPSKYRVEDYQVCASSWDELDAAITGAKHD
jgi:hypothetical protein